MNKKHRLEIRLTEEERVELEKASKICNLDLSKYVRETLHNRSKRILAKASK